MKTLTFGQGQSFVRISIFVVCIKKTLTVQGFVEDPGTPIYREIKFLFSDGSVELSLILF